MPPQSKFKPIESELPLQISLMETTFLRFAPLQKSPFVKPHTGKTWGSNSSRSYIILGHLRSTNLYPSSWGGLSRQILDFEVPNRPKSTCFFAYFRSKTPKLPIWVPPTEWIHEFQQLSPLFKRVSIK